MLAIGVMESQVGFLTMPSLQKVNYNNNNNNNKPKRPKFQVG